MGEDDAELQMMYFSCQDLFGKRNPWMWRFGTNRKSPSLISSRKRRHEPRFLVFFVFLTRYVPYSKLPSLSLAFLAFLASLKALASLASLAPLSSLSQPRHQTIIIIINLPPFINTN